MKKFDYRSYGVQDDNTVIPIPRFSCVDTACALHLKLRGEGISSRIFSLSGAGISHQYVVPDDARGTDNALNNRFGPTGDPYSPVLTVAYVRKHGEDMTDLYMEYWEDR
ncbi:MAG: hypothetical protein GF368_00565 [Candidatus Aenigmarchaeota archaeon]|nr:hypothetical protein [Candidatus Aenigmarchaeota archaeon]